MMDPDDWEAVGVQFPAVLAGIDDRRVPYEAVCDVACEDQDDVVA